MSLYQVPLGAVQEAAGPGGGDGIRLLQLKKDMKFSRNCPFIRFYCALYKKLLDLGVATPSTPFSV
jgi:hypothetical protein